MRSISISLILLALATAIAFPTNGSALEFQVSIPAEIGTDPIDGRVLLLLSTSAETEPRFQVRAGFRAIQIFGIDVDGLAPGATVSFDEEILGYPIEGLDDLPPGQKGRARMTQRGRGFWPR